MSNRFSGFPATIDFDGSSVHLRQLESYGFSPNAQKSYLNAGGSLDRISAGLASARPMHRFTTRDLETILNNVSMTLGVTSAGATWRYQQRQCQSGFKTGLSHVNRLSTGGWIRPVSIGASEDDVNGALANLEYYSISADGIARPDTKISGVNFASAPAVAFVSQYFLGPTYHNGTKIDGIDQAEVNFGLNPDSKLFDGVFPTCVTVANRTPSITLTGTNMAIAGDSLDSFINATTGTGFTQYFRRGAQGNSRVADASTVHLGITVIGEWCVNDESWSQTDDGQVSVEIQALNGSVSVNSATAIP